MTRRDEVHSKRPKFFGEYLDYKGFYRYNERAKKQAHRWYRIQSRTVCRSELREMSN